MKMENMEFFAMFFALSNDYVKVLEVSACINDDK